MKLNFVFFTMSKILLFLPRLPQNVLIFLLIEHYFLTKIISLSMGEPFLIPTESFFWIQIHAEEGLL